MAGILRRFIVKGDEASNVDAIALVVGDEEPAIGVGAQFSKMKLNEIDKILDENEGIDLMMLEAIAAEQLEGYTFDIPEERKDKLKEEKLIVAPAMIVDRLILRHDADTDEYYYGFFNEEDVANSAEGFQKYDFGKMFNINHDQDSFVDGVYLKDTWIIEDSEIDKAYYYGYNLPVGSWMVSVKFENEQLYDEIVASGKLNGLSVEARLIEQMLLTRDS